VVSGCRAFFHYSGNHGVSFICGSKEECVKPVDKKSCATTADMRWRWRAASLSVSAVARNTSPPIRY